MTVHKWFFFNRLRIVVFFFLQAQRVHWVCIPHSPAFLASPGLAYPLCFASGFHVLYAHSIGCWLSHCRPPYCNPHWFSRAIQGTAADQLSPDLFIYSICSLEQENPALIFLLFFHQTSVLHMCSLFHAFMFAQLWTIYCEQAAAAPAGQNQNQNEFSSSAILTGLEFWSRVTPSILQLMAHNKVVR